MQFPVFPDQRLVLIDELTDLGEQCGRCSIASSGQLGLGSAAPFGGARGHQLIPSLTDKRAPVANSLASLINPLASTDLDALVATDTVEGRDGNILQGFAIDGYLGRVMEH